jgi:PD-(D/E)XK endonuclease
MFTTYQKGEVGRLKVALRATELGYIVSVPTVESRYDLVIDDGTKLHRVQVKYSTWEGSEVSNAIQVKFKTECRNNGYKKTYSAKEIDAIVVYLPQTDKCYWITAKHFKGRNYLSLRLKASKNKQVKGTHRAKDFEW